MSGPSQAPRSPGRTDDLSSRHLAFLHLSRHTLKQLKFVLPGGLVTYVLGTTARFWRLVEEEHGWARCVFSLVHQRVKLNIQIDLLMRIQVICAHVTGVRPFDHRPLPVHPSRAVDKGRAT